MGMFAITSDPQLFAWGSDADPPTPIAFPCRSVTVCCKRQNLRPRPGTLDAITAPPQSPARCPLPPFLQILCVRPMPGGCFRTSPPPPGISANPSGLEIPLSQWRVPGALSPPAPDFKSPPTSRIGIQLWNSATQFATCFRGISVLHSFLAKFSHTSFRDYHPNDPESYRGACDMAATYFLGSSHRAPRNPFNFRSAVLFLFFFHPPEQSGDPLGAPFHLLRKFFLFFPFLPPLGDMLTKTAQSACLERKNPPEPRPPSKGCWAVVFS